MDLEKYETQNEDGHLRYTFISRGASDIMKIIAFQKLPSTISFPRIGELMVYNLAFGDRKGTTLDIDDKINSNNGDMRKVFNTVLHTIPIFFSKYPKTCIVVEGSDNKRIRIYCNYVSRNYETLTEEYTFYGVTGSEITSFVTGTIYKTVVFLPI